MPNAKCKYGITFIFSQYTTIRQWVPVCSMADYWGAAAIEAIENFEKCEKQGVRVHTFRSLQAIIDPLYMRMF